MLPLVEAKSTVMALLLGPTAPDVITVPAGTVHAKLEPALKITEYPTPISLQLGVIFPETTEVVGIMD